MASFLTTLKSATGLTSPNLRQTEAEQSSIKHFEHSYASSLIYHYPLSLCPPQAPITPKHQNNRNNHHGLPLRSTTLTLSSSCIKATEQIGSTLTTQSERTILQIDWRDIVEIKWDHQTSQVRFSFVDLKPSAPAASSSSSASGDNGGGGEVENPNVIFIIKNTLELEANIKLRLAGISKSLNTTTTTTNSTTNTSKSAAVKWKPPSIKYIGIFAGVTKPKPFQRKRASLTLTTSPSLPQLQTMRTMALDSYKGSGAPYSSFGKEALITWRLELAVEHVYDGTVSFMIGRHSGFDTGFGRGNNNTNNANGYGHGYGYGSEYDGSGSGSGNNSKGAGGSQGQGQDQKLVFSENCITYYTDKTTNEVGLLLKYTEIREWKIVDTLRSRSSNRLCVVGKDTGLSFTFELLTDRGDSTMYPSYLHLRHVFEFFWNQHLLHSDLPCLPHSTHGRNITNVFTLQGQKDPGGCVSGLLDVRNLDGAVVLNVAEKNRRASNSKLSSPGANQGSGSNGGNDERRGSNPNTSTSQVGSGKFEALRRNSANTDAIRRASLNNTRRNSNSLLSKIQGLGIGGSGVTDKAPVMERPGARDVWKYVVKHQGYLTKKGGVGINGKKWLDRYFVLYSTAMGHFLSYYSSWDDSPMFSNKRKERNMIDLSKVTFIRPVSNQSDAPSFSFDVVTIEREWTLCAKDEEDMQMWLQIVTNAVDEDVAIVPDDELTFVVKCIKENTNSNNDDNNNNNTQLMELNKYDYSTLIKVSSNGVSVGTISKNNKDYNEHYFWCYTDFYKWSVQTPGGKLAFLVSVFTSDEFCMESKVDLEFRTVDSVRLASAVEYFIEKFMSCMYLVNEGLEDDESAAQSTSTSTSKNFGRPKSNSIFIDTDVTVNGYDDDMPPLPLPSPSPAATATATVDLLNIDDDDYNNKYRDNVNKYNDYNDYNSNTSNTSNSNNFNGNNYNSNNSSNYDYDYDYDSNIAPLSLLTPLKSNKDADANAGAGSGSELALVERESEFDPFADMHYEAPPKTITNGYDVVDPFASASDFGSSLPSQDPPSSPPPPPPPVIIKDVPANMQAMKNMLSIQAPYLSRAYNSASSSSSSSSDGIDSTPAIAEVLYSDPGVITVLLKQEWKGCQGRISLGFVNASSQDGGQFGGEVSSLSDLKVTVDDGDGDDGSGGGVVNGLKININAQPNNASIDAGKTKTFQVMVECVSPLPPFGTTDHPFPTVTLTFLRSNSASAQTNKISTQKHTIKLSLPITTLNFVETIPSSMPPSEFLRRWQHLSTPTGVQEQTVLQLQMVKTTSDSFVRSVLEGCGFSCIIDDTTDTASPSPSPSSPSQSSNAGICAVATLRTGAINSTIDSSSKGDKISVGVLVRIEVNTLAKAYRVTVRSGHKLVSLGVLKGVVERIEFC